MKSERTSESSLSERNPKPGMLRRLGRAVLGGVRELIADTSAQYTDSYVTSAGVLYDERTAQDLGLKPRIGEDGSPWVGILPLAEARGELLARREELSARQISSGMLASALEGSVMTSFDGMVDEQLSRIDHALIEIDGHLQPTDSL